MDNYKVAVETADKCCQANAQFAEISEVCNRVTYNATAPGECLMLCSCLGQVMTGQFSATLTVQLFTAVLIVFICTVGQ